MYTRPCASSGLPERQVPAVKPGYEGKQLRSRPVVDCRHAVQLEVALRLGGQLLREESHLEHRQQLGHLPGSPRAQGLHLGRRWFERDLTRPPAGDEISGARRAIETIENAFRHLLGTSFTSASQPRSHKLRVGHASRCGEGRFARRHCEKAVLCTHYREVRQQLCSTRGHAIGHGRA